MEPNTGSGIDVNHLNTLVQELKLNSTLKPTKKEIIEVYFLNSDSDDITHYSELELSFLLKQFGYKYDPNEIKEIWTRIIEEQSDLNDKKFDLLDKFIKTKDTTEKFIIQQLCSKKDLLESGIDYDSILKKYRYALKYFENEKDSIKELKEIEDLNERIKITRIVVTYLEEIDKLKKVLQKNRIRIDYVSLLQTVHEKVYLDLKISYLEKIEEIIEELKTEFQPKPSKIDIVKKFFSYSILDKIDNYPEFELSVLLKHFGYRYNPKEIEDIWNKLLEDNEIEIFESKLGKKPLPTIPEITDEYFIGMSGIEFEDFLGYFFEISGYVVTKTPKSGDQGADLILKKNNERIVVQAKCYSNQSVENKAVQEAIAAKLFYGADKAMVVTNSKFTRSAIQLANKSNVELWDGDRLTDEIKRLKENYLVKQD